MKKKIFITLFFILALFAVVFVLLGFLKKRNENDTEIITDVITRGNLVSEITSTGTLEAVGTVEVGTQISGVIDEIKVDFNSTVEEGETLAVLDSRSLRASLFEAQSNYEKSLIQMDQTKRELERIKQLYDQNLVSQQEYDNQIDAFEIARSTFNQTQAQLYRTKINYDYTVITSPISGVVISRNVDEGQTVAASLNTPTLFKIASDLTDMQIEALIDETDIGIIREGQKVVFDVDAFPEDTFEGVVSQVRLQPELVQNVVKYVVIVKVQNPDLKLLPGMTANLTVIIDSREDVLSVLNGAFLFSPPPEVLENFVNSSSDSMNTPDIRPRGRNPGASSPSFATIWIKRGDQIVPIKVTKGMTDGSRTEISGEDFQEGDSVVLSMTDGDFTSGNSQRSPFLPGRGR